MWTWRYGGLILLLFTPRLKKLWSGNKYTSVFVPQGTGGVPGIDGLTGDKGDKVRCRPLLNPG